jgi:hypothetical protein
VPDVQRVAASNAARRAIDEIERDGAAGAFRIDENRTSRQASIHASPDLLSSRFPKFLLYRCRCRVLSELEAGATESAAFSSSPSLSPALPATGISQGGASPCRHRASSRRHGRRSGRAQLAGGQIKPSAPSGPPLWASGARHHIIGTFKLNGRAAKRRMQWSLPAP